MCHRPLGDSELPVQSDDPGFERIRARNLLFEYVNEVNERGVLPAVRERMCHKLHQGPELPLFRQELDIPQ
ncbi:hypothetical protein sphantq_00746 [Sphingobium sp. AntQ-1]|nr:hypothetical protein sphantq_00746 [Sphingobium sp. AntQ-1]